MSDELQTPIQASLPGGPSSSQRHERRASDADTTAARWRDLSQELWEAAGELRERDNAELRRRIARLCCLEVLSQRYSEPIDG